MESFENLINNLLTHDIRKLRKKWDFKRAQALEKIFRIYGETIGDLEAWYLYMDELLPIFYKLPVDIKWQAMSLLLDRQSDGGVANEIGAFLLKNVSRTQLKKIINDCPDDATKVVFNEYLQIYYPRRK